MGDNDYENIDNWRPILIDGVRDPWKSWWEHRARGSMGGVDCAALEGTPIHAPANCSIRNTGLEAGGSGGRTATAIYNTGWKDQFMHLQTLVPEGGYQKGMVIGYTGRSVASGYPPVPQHLHWHRIDPSGSYQDPYGWTSRRNPWDYFPGAAYAGAGGVPIEEEERIWPKMWLKYDTGGTGFLITESGITGISSQEWNLAQRVVNSDPSTAGPSTDPFLRTEMSILDAALKRAANGPKNF